MKNKSVCVICEGYEEKEYFDKLISLNIFSGIYDFKNNVFNAKGITNIFPIYQGKYSSALYHLVLIFCDTDKLTDKNYKTLKENICAFMEMMVLIK